MKIVSSAKISDKHQRSLKENYPQVEFNFFDNMEEVEMDTEAIKNMEVLITYGEDLTEKLIEDAISLKWIQVISAGIDKLPFALLKEKDILVTNAKGIHQIPMSEYTMAVILQLARRTHELYIQQKNNIWDRTIRVSEVNGATLGIIGLGAIGQAIIDKAKAFGMRVIGMNSDGRPISNVDKVYQSNQINKLLSESDYVVVIVPLTTQTHHLIGKEQLSFLKESAYIINIARGEVIDETALYEALKSKRIAGAVLDVFSEEPLPNDHPFWQLDNCIITPHLSGRSPYYMERSLEIFNNNMKRYLNEENKGMINLIDLKKGY